LRGYSRQRFVLVTSYVVRSTIGYHSNSWASCELLACYGCVSGWSYDYNRAGRLLVTCVRAEPVIRHRWDYLASADHQPS